MEAPDVLQGVSTGLTATAAMTLRSWLADATGLDVQAGLPATHRAAEPGHLAIGATLVGLALDADMAWEAGRSTLRLRARFLVWVDGSEADALEVVDTAIVAADRRGDTLLDLVGVTPATWTALGCAVRPAIVVEVPASVERPSTPAPVVRSPLIVDAQPAGPLQGRVVGPNGVGLAGARVVLLATGAVTRTADDGAFLFPLAPAGAPEWRFEVEARGLALVATVPAARPGAGDEGVVIAFEPTER